MYTDSPIEAHVLSDCLDANAMARLAAACGMILGSQSTQFAPIQGVNGTLTASLTIVDILEIARQAAELGSHSKLVILGNAASRSDSWGEFPNGVPFGYVKIGENAILLTTMTPELLHMPQRLIGVTELNVFDIPTVMEWAVGRGLINLREATRIINTQFRSLEFAPLAVAWVLKFGDEVPTTRQALKDAPPHVGRVMRIDEFTNGQFANPYTGLILSDLRPEYRERARLWDGRDLKVYLRLADVPKGDMAIVVSSSGYDTKRVLMVAINGGNAARELGITVGAQLIHSDCIAA